MSDPGSRSGGWGNWAAAVVLAAAALAGLAVLYFWRPEDVPFLPRCPFFALTGLKCPGCGSTRAVHALLHLDVRAAWNYNPALFVVAPLLAVLAARPRLAHNVRLVAFLLAAALLYWILRNVPWR